MELFSCASQREFRLLPRQLEKLRCLHTGSPLQPPSAALINQINRQVTDGKLRDYLGRVVDSKLDAGLTNSEATMCYPILDSAIQMMRDEAIPLGQLGDFGLQDMASRSLSNEKGKHDE